MRFPYQHILDSLPKQMRLPYLHVLDSIRAFGLRLLNLRHVVLLLDHPRIPIAWRVIREGVVAGVQMS